MWRSSEIVTKLQHWPNTSIFPENFEILDQKIKYFLTIFGSRPLSNFRPILVVLSDVSPVTTKLGINMEKIIFWIKKTKKCQLYWFQRSYFLEKNNFKFLDFLFFHICRVSITFYGASKFSIFSWYLIGN